MITLRYNGGNPRIYSWVIIGELVSFETKDGLTLHGFLVRSKRKSDKALIHVHGLHGNFYSSGFAKALARMAANNGFNFLSIELRGSYVIKGFRFKKGRKFKWLSAGSGLERFEDCVYDIEGAIKFLGKLGVTKIFLEGHSTGCQKITYYQYKKRDKRVKALILSAPADDYNLEKHAFGNNFGRAVKLANRLYKKNRDTFMPESYYAAKGFSAGRFLSFSDLRFVEARIFNYESKRLIEFHSVKKPVLVIFGSKEEYALKPVSEYMKILEKNTGSRKFDHIIIKNADHGFSKKEDETANKIVKWLCKIE